MAKEDEVQKESAEHQGRWLKEKGALRGGRRNGRKNRTRTMDPSRT